MSPTQDPGPAPVSRAVAVTGPSPKAAETFLTIQETLKADRGAEAKAIQAMFGGDKELMNRFLAVAFSALASNTDLLTNCTPMSLIQSVKDAAALGLEPTGLTGEGAIIRYGTQAQFQPMWRGYLKRIRNSRKVLDVDCQLVYLNDDFRFTLGTDPSIHHAPVLFGEKDETTGEFLQERGGYRGAYAWALMPSGMKIIEYMAEADINQVRDQFSRGAKGSSSPWTTSWGEMARKTVIRRLAKRLPGEAVDQLLLADAQADNAADALRLATAAATESVSGLQKIALRAVGQLPAPTADADPADPQGPSEKVGEFDGSHAVMVEAVEGDTVKVSDPVADGRAGGVCGAPSPYDDGACILVPGHGGNHKGADKSTWN